MPFRSSTLLGAALVLAAGASSPVMARDEAGRQVFPAAFFAPMSPTTALDMVTRLPGFVLSEGDPARRGLGDSFGNVLIDGERPSNKSLLLADVLQRIPAADVERIELIDADLPGIDRHGHARVANIVLRDRARASGSYQALWRYFDGGPALPAGSASVTRTFGPVEATAAVSFSLWSPRFVRDRDLSGAGGVLLRRTGETERVLDREIVPSLSLKADLEDGSSLRLDSELRVWTYRQDLNQTLSTPTPGGLAPAQRVRSRTEDHGGSLRVSATYQRALAADLTSRTILLASQDDNNQGPQRLETTFLATSGVEAEIVTFDERRREFALRQTLTWRLRAGHAVEFGGEGALNTADSRLSILFDDGAVVTPVDLPIADTEIEEWRGEAFVQHSWTAGERLSLISGLRWEFSQLTQEGDANQQRRFNYAKPSLVADYRLDGGQRLRLALRRTVDQLDFSKFASAVDLSDDNASIGNPDYVPQRSWTLEAEYQRRWRGGGALLLRLEHAWVEDLDDWVAVATDQGVFDAPGNIGDGRRWRLRAEVSTSLGRLGVDGARLDLAYVFQNTTVTDPLTGEERRWSDERDHVITATYRQVLPRRALAWGWTYSWRSEAVTFRARERRIDATPSGSLNLYVESAAWPPAVLRLGLDGLVPSGDQRERLFFAGSRASGVVERREERDSRRGAIVYLQLKGTF